MNKTFSFAERRPSLRGSESRLAAPGRRGRAAGFALPFAAAFGRLAPAMPIPTANLAARSAAPPPTRRGEARFWRIAIALFIGGFATFALLYCVQWCRHVSTCHRTLHINN
jgi:hypothetical protein